MITFSRLGTHGRLGNQLFEVAATLAVAAKSGDVAVFPPWAYAHCFRHPVRTEHLPPGSCTVWEQPTFHYSPLPAHPNLDLFGYFQSERFFAEVADQVRYHFQPSEAVERELDDRFGDLDAERCVAVHVRRGDYVGADGHFPLVPLHYYFQAAHLFGSDWRYLLVSDDLAWCRSHLLPLLPRGRACLAPEAPDYLHLFLLARCAHQIIANSTFSWWGAWLNSNPHKVVVAPRPWFGPALPCDTTDLIPPSWLTLYW